MNENFEIKEEADYEKGGFTISEIILRHLRKISDICCQEQTGGYWNKKPVKTASGVMFTEEYHPDLREAYSEAVDFLIDVLYEMADKQFKQYIDLNDNCEWMNINDSNERIKERRRTRRLIFKEINKMFERTNFWKRSDSSDE